MLSRRLQAAVSPPIAAISQPIFGLSTVTPSGKTSDQAIADQEALVGVGYKYALLHQYHLFDTSFPTASENARSTGGQELLLSWQSKLNNGTIVTWAAVASGSYDSIINAQADRIKAMASRVWVNYCNEPETTITTYLTPGQFGTEAEYVAAWRHIHDVFVARGVENVVWTLAYAGINTTNKQNVTMAMYPGDAYVDYICWDPYNWAEARGNAWLTFSAMVNPWYTWATANLSSTKPYMLAETGTQSFSTDPSLKPAWFANMHDTFQAKTYPLLKGAVYFNHSTADGASGNWLIDETPECRAAYNAAITAVYT